MPTRREPTEKQKAKMARPLVLDFTDVPDVKGPRQNKPRAKVMTPKQIRARARRSGRMTKEEFAVLYKPIEEWDEEELARGRPRDKNGKFTGQPPQWLTREVHEAAMKRFNELLRMDIRIQGATAMGVIRNLMLDGTMDKRGRYRVPPSTRLAAAQLMLEHNVGKPTQRVEQDISVKMQAMLASVMVGPGQAGNDEVLQAAAQARYEEAYGELPSSSVMMPNAEERQRGVIDAEEIEDDD